MRLVERSSDVLLREFTERCPFHLRLNVAVEPQHGNPAHFRSEATRGDCLVSVRDIDVEAAEIVFTFGTALA
jgi:hypothetical protein